MWKMQAVEMAKLQDEQCYAIAQHVLLSLEPKMRIKQCVGNCFALVPFKHLIQLSYDCHASTWQYWQYAFVNVSKKIYKMTFISICDFLDAVFECNEIWFGTEHFQNPMFGKTYESIAVEMDLATIK